MAARLNARIDAPLAEKVATLRRVTGQTTTDVVRVAIERYFESVEREARPYEALTDGGFIGCAEGPADLSVTYKDDLAESIERKLGAPARRPRSKAAKKTTRRIGKKS